MPRPSTIDPRTDPQLRRPSAPRPAPRTRLDPSPCSVHEQQVPRDEGHHGPQGAQDGTVRPRQRHLVRRRHQPRGREGRSALCRPRHGVPGSPPPHGARTDGDEHRRVRLQRRGRAHVRLLLRGRRDARLVRAGDGRLPGPRAAHSQARALEDRQACAVTRSQRGRQPTPPRLDRFPQLLAKVATSSTTSSSHPRRSTTASISRWRSTVSTRRSSSSRRRHRQAQAVGALEGAALANGTVDDGNTGIVFLPSSPNRAVIATTKTDSPYSTSARRPTRA